MGEDVSLIACLVWSMEGLAAFLEIVLSEGTGALPPSSELYSTLAGQTSRKKEGSLAVGWQEGHWRDRERHQFRLPRRGQARLNGSSVLSPVWLPLSHHTAPPKLTLLLPAHAVVRTGLATVHAHHRHCRKRDAEPGPRRARDRCLLSAAAVERDHPRAAQCLGERPRRQRRD